MDELKSCPFCGNAPVMGCEFHRSSGSYVALRAVVRCQKCGTEKHVVFTASDFYLIPYSDYERAFKKVCDEWNGRADGQ